MVSASSSSSEAKTNSDRSIEEIVNEAAESAMDDDAVHDDDAIADPSAVKKSEGHDHSDADALPAAAAAAAFSPDLSFIRISELTKSDIVCGRGIPWTSYAGNQQMHVVVDGFRDKYLTCHKKEKRYWVRHVLQLLKQEYGARFVKQVQVGEADNDAEHEQEAATAEDSTKAAAPVVFRFVDDQGEY